MLKPLTGIIFSTIVLASPVTARAEPAEAVSEAHTIMSVRFGLPLTDLIAAKSDYFGISGYDLRVQLVGGSVSVRFVDFVETEVALRYWTVINCLDGPSVGARAGLSPSLTHSRGTHTSWRLRIPVLLGWDYWIMSRTGCDFIPDERMHSFNLAAGLDTTYWGSKSGFNMRVLAFGGFGRYQYQNRDYVEAAGIGPLFGLAFDFGFSIPIRPVGGGK
jgi:hypothetical protein